MASRRMFSPRITNSSKFLKMPHSSQSLYFHLCMNADDDGVVEAYTVIKSVNAQEDDYNILTIKEFIKPLNEDMVTYVIDWQEHNLIRADRKIDSIYKELLQLAIPQIELIEPIKRADTRKKTQFGRPVDTLWSAQVSIDKGNIGDTNTLLIETTYKDEFETFWIMYPKKVGKKKCNEIWNRMTPISRKMALEDVPKRKDDDKWANGFIKDPERYLKQEQWNDEIIAPRVIVSQQIDLRTHK